ncbi:extracellular solute-binding protein [Paenibacillus sp. VCA1]|uniref:extracellular solute-binding protein n=1 Tax=Paenibacillus sp. VCA1 TaxID=3039148 RepID=UPI0028728F2D|nr:extracellular solute-binding protein [Paenibacillus sp. VCA1]MDR9855719.1 extracellular solute-binding protein [Paenibacillus sp. VCA1]
MNNRFGANYRFILTLLATLGIIALVSLWWSGAPSASRIEANSQGAIPAGLMIAEDPNGYAHYLKEHAQATLPAEAIRMDAVRDLAPSKEAVKTMAFEGAKGTAVLSDEEGELTWQVDVKQGGLYNLAVRYYPVEGRSEEIERSLRIDGKAPFSEAERLIFPRIWGNQSDTIQQDSHGNDLRPSQVEKPAWHEVVLTDTDGYFDEPFRFYLPEGKHTITLQSVREPMLIDYLQLQPVQQVPAYEELKETYKQHDFSSPSGVMVKIQGEAASSKSSPTLYPLADRSSPATEPYDLTKVRLNTIGGNNWRIPGQIITWKVNVPEDGLYKIGIKYRQNLVQSLEVTRKLMIDGKVPFAEANDISFRPGGSWQMLQLGSRSDEPYLFYLSKGEHELSLEVTLGQMTPLLASVESTILELNQLYRKIIMITGASPDPYRDYELQKQIPELQQVFEKQAGQLSRVIAGMEELSGGKNERTAVLNTTAFQLKDLAAEPESITKRLDAFKSNIVALGTWILTAKELPLEIDYLLVASEDQSFPKPDVSWLKHAMYGIKSFGTSFFVDYGDVGTVDSTSDQDAVDVWVTGGRDQAQLIKTMIDTSFTPQTGIPVRLQLVDPSVLLPATLAGSGPDVALQQDNVVNLAMRNALQDLSQFGTFQNVKKRFMDSAFVPFEYEGGVYSIPEQQTFPMLFYRKDILEEIGVSPPQTWDDLYALIPVLNKRQMNIGLTPELTMDILLYQNGGSYYKNGGKASGLDSEEALAAFKHWTDLYTNYKAPQTFDFLNRFRIGEMPVGIADYTTYNSLIVFAPEIRGLWGFMPVPGFRGQDGTIHREAASTTLGSVMFKTAKNKENAWKFIDWWTDKEAQLTYGREMEALMGSAARYPTANMEALRELPWPKKDYDQLLQQMEWVRGIPDVPGGYFTKRHLNNAFFQVLNNGTNPRETLKDYVRTINQEITVKRKEFKLPTD